jgi:MFS family permease
LRPAKECPSPVQPEDAHAVKPAEFAARRKPVLPRAAGKPDSARAWLIVAAAFVAGFVVFGVTYSFGVFLEPIAAEFQVSHAAASVLFSITGLVFYLSGSLTGRLSDRFGPAPVVGTGAALMGASLVVASLLQRLWIGYLVYGLGVGLGAACVYVPTLALVGGWFARHRTAALGLAAAGTGCGMLIVPPAAAALIAAFGWRAAFLVLGLGSAALLAACTAIVASPPLAGANEHRGLGRTVRSRAFVLLYVSWVLATTALFVPFVFLPAFALERGVGPVAASALLSLFGGASILGRVGIGPLGSRIGIVILFKISVFAMAASYGWWLAATSYTSLVGFAIVLGLAYGIRIALMPGVLIEAFGTRDLGAVLGAFFTASGIAAAIGPPLAGAIVDLSGDHRLAIAFALATGALGFAAVVPLKLGGKFD